MHNGTRHECRNDQAPLDLDLDLDLVLDLDRACPVVPFAFVQPIRTSRVARFFMAHPFKADEQRSRLLAKLVRELITAETFQSLADLVGALKLRCARLHVGWTNDDINDALRLVASNVPLPGARVRAATRRRMAERERAIEHREITRAEASAILFALGVRL